MYRITTGLSHVIKSQIKIRALNFEFSPSKDQDHRSSFAEVESVCDQSHYYHYFACVNNPQLGVLAVQRAEKGKW